MNKIEKMKNGQNVRIRISTEEITSLNDGINTNANKLIYNMDSIIISGFIYGNDDLKNIIDVFNEYKYDDEYGNDAYLYILIVNDIDVNAGIVYKIHDCNFELNVLDAYGRVKTFSLEFTPISKNIIKLINGGQ